MAEYETEMVVEVETVAEVDAELESHLAVLVEVVHDLGGGLSGEERVVEMLDLQGMRRGIHLKGVTRGQVTHRVIELFPELDRRGVGDEAAWVLTTFGECEQGIPYADQWERRNANGIRELTCAHSPEHVTVLG